MKFEPSILVIEDDPLVADLFRELLPAQGYRADVVVDGESALERFAERPYDLLLSDKNLPGISGIELLKQIKTIDPDVDVIIMTAYADTQSVLAAMESGVYDYLVKPFDSIDDVMAKIGRALEKRRIIRENRRLVDYLTQANAQIEAMNRDLEAQVNDRTRQLTEANARLEQLSLTDDVTGLHNQRFLYARLEEEFRRARRYNENFSIVMIDVDNFKAVNDGHDHLFGSHLLRQLGELFREVVRNIDFVIRYGGDEFVFLLPHTTLADAVIVAERLRAAVAAADLGQEGERCKVTISLGVAAIHQAAGDDARSLLRAADMALYQAKEGGRNRVVVMDGQASTVVAGMR